MLRVSSLLLVVTFAAVVCGVPGLFRADSVGPQAESRLTLHETRAADSDLEVRGLSNSSPRFVTHISLEALPQVEAVVTSDENFPELPKGGTRVKGVDFGVLEGALGLQPGAVAVEGVCLDGYTPPFSVEYTKRHHPILVLTVEGMTPKAWAQKTRVADMGPYFVAYDNFVPAFRVLSHEDRPQVPVQLVRLEFAPEDRMFAGIKPAGSTDAQTIQGYTIAQQNCFRCHTAAGYGGTMSGKNWKTLAMDAQQRPEWFAQWVHDSKSVNINSTMPPNPKYDRATLAALTKYFSAMK